MPFSKAHRRAASEHHTRAIERFKKKERAPLSVQELRLVEEYTLDFNETEASMRAGVPLLEARGMLKRHVVQAAIQIYKHRRASRTEIYADEVLRRWLLLATADSRELIQLRMVNCRYCWGIDHRYQFRDTELREAQQRHEINMLELSEDQRKPFDDLGGSGYDGGKAPMRGELWVERQIEAGLQFVSESNSDHNCPHCDGDGVKSVWLNDSRHYSPSAALLYAGVKISKDGSMEVKTRDQQHAEHMIAQHLGMFAAQKNINLNLDPTQLSDEQLDDAIRRFADVSKRESGPLLEHSSAGEAEEDEG